MKKDILTISCVSLALLCFSSMNLVAQELEDSLINVAFGTVERQDLLGGISTINISELQKKSYSQGSLDGVQSFVGGYTGNIWGQGALILIDGVPRAASDVRATEVESVTVLKGASAVVLYGSKAAKGVVLITTKRGKKGPMRIDIQANTGLYVPKAYPKYLDATSYMTLYNEACRNDGITERYTKEQIYYTSLGTNPYRYPDVDFFTSEYLRKAYNRTDVTGEIHGGNERTRYYTNFGMTYNNNLVKYGEQAKNKDLEFNIRANVDMKLTEWLSSYADASVRYHNNYTGRGNFWGSSATFRPNLFAPLVPIEMMDSYSDDLQTIVTNSNHLIDGKYLLGGTSDNMTNTFSDMLAAGYIKYKTRNFLFNVGVKADLSMILPGLSFKTAYSVDYTNYFSEAYKQDYATFQPTWSNVNGKDMIIGLQKFNEDKSSTNENIGDSKYTQTMSFSAQFNYNRTFNNLHNVSAAFLGWGYQKQLSVDADHDGSDYHRDSNVNLGLQAGYNYAHKYYADFSAAVVHSAKLPEGKRNAFSPAITLGWRISGEDFFKENVSFVNNLKFNVSYAKLHQDIDIAEYYMYKGYYVDNGGWYQWLDNTAGGNTTGSKRGDNPNMTFITREEFRAGLESSLFDNLITLDVNYFLQHTNGMLTQGSATIYPAYFSSWDYSFLPYLNYNNDKRMGVDFSMNVNKRIGEVDATFGFVGMYMTSEATRRDEVYAEDYQYRVGKPIDAYWGYICEGFFQDEADISKHAVQKFGEVKPGDLKYKDINGDKIIDSEDEVYLGKNGWAVSPFSFGLNMTLKWKNFTLFAMGTGRTGAIGFKNSDYFWVRGARKYSDIVWGRWTENTKETATYPRLTTTDNGNNYRNSTFWMYRANRFDLTKLQLTYDIPKQKLKHSFINSLSMYISGDNLLTISKERELMETNVGSAPQCRYFNIGVKASF